MKLFNSIRINETNEIMVNCFDEKYNGDSFKLPSEKEEMLMYALEKGKRRNELIDCIGSRGWGFTHCLIKFAKQNGYMVVGGYLNREKQQLREKYQYKHIYSNFKEMTGLNSRFVVVDILANCNESETKCFKIITGFRQNECYMRNI